MDDISPVWRYIRVGLRCQNSTDMDGLTNNIYGASAELSAGQRLASEVQYAASELLTPSQTSDMLSYEIVQVIDLTQPSAEDLAGNIVPQPPCVVYIYADQLSLTSNEVPQLQGKGMPSQHVMPLQLAHAACGKPDLAVGLQTITSCRASTPSCTASMPPKLDQRSYMWMLLCPRLQVHVCLSQPCVTGSIIAQRMLPLYDLLIGTNLEQCCQELLTKICCAAHLGMQAQRCFCDNPFGLSAMSC